MKTYAITLALVTMLAPATTLAAQPWAQPPSPTREPRPLPRKTIENLNKAIQGEANAAYRYTLFAQRADVDGHRQVGRLFRAAARAESIHRRNHEQVLRDLGVEPERPVFEDVTVRTTRKNLEMPIRGERKEQEEMYPAMIVTARRERVPAAVQSFTFAQNTELEHARLFRDALAQLGHNPRTDYYVGEMSGDTVTKVPATPREVYLRVD